MDDVKARPYRSPRRDEQARQTRGAVLAGARELFLDPGYHATTIDEIAAAAGVSKPTVFTAVGNKTQLLKVVRDVAMAGDDAAAPVAERPSVERARDAPTAAPSASARRAAPRCRPWCRSSSASPSTRRCR